ncbi:MAG: epimerase [Candidatus Marinimicrobia bacterium]|nr:epimerase [Candidatus Neomarinimicrobiota bacterium]|tara:strand:- start:1937 stop:2803 length:867 start_codon:yes stop_codon:yes gene_type:complete
MKLLVTGPTGFLGYHLCKSLVKTDLEIVAISRNPPPLERQVNSKKISYISLSEINIDRFIKSSNFKGVIHCATNYGRDDKTLDTLQTNLTFPLSILLSSIKANVSFFINTDTILDKRVNSYSLSKNQFLDWLYYFQNKICCLNLSLEHFYGPGDSDGKFTSFIIRELINNVETIRLTQGKQKRDFIYIADVVSAFECIIKNINNFKKGSIHELQIGSGENTSIYDFVNLAKEITLNYNTMLDFGAIPYRENEVMESEVDLKLISSLGWKPKVSLKKGLELTIAGELKS